MGNTKISWCDKTWNPITGCTKCSPGCENRYAERMSKRLVGRCGYPKENPFAVTFHPDKLQEPMRWKKPSRIFVCSMGDIFHPDVKDEWIDQIFAVMALCPQHTFMVLTKRPERMREYVIDTIERGMTWREGVTGRLPNNIWLGVTAENQEQADKRIPFLLDTPAAKRFVSVEPMLGEVYLSRYLHCKHDHNHDGDCHKHPYGCPNIDWVICGGETGPGARPMHPDWARSLRDQCQAASVPLFFKQWGEYEVEKRETPNVLGSKGNGRPFVAWPDGSIGEGDYREKGGYGLHLLRVGKRRAGHLLDGQAWRQVP